MEFHEIGTRQPNMLSVAFIPEWYGSVMSPCASIRMYGFLRSLAAAGKISLEILVPDEIERTRADVFVWHRVALTEQQVRRLGEHARRTSAAMIYDLDDNLLEMDDHPEREAYAPLQAAVKASCDTTHVVWCSTRRLSERIKASCGIKHVEHLPNVLDPLLWGRKVAERGLPSSSLQLLYMGTRTHEEDFSFLYKCIEAARKKDMAIDLHVIGVRTRDQSGPEWLHTVEIPQHIGSSYPAFVNWASGLRGYDAGVAPLLSSRFNDCKSHIKVLDYAGMGLPAIASSMPAYADALEDGNNIVLAENSTRGWIEAIARLVDATARGKILSGARMLIEGRQFEDGCKSRMTSMVAISDTQGASFDPR